jgi:hypothetical protein
MPFDAHLWLRGAPGALVNRFELRKIDGTFGTNSP